MAKNINELPFTEIVERASQLARERSDVSNKVRGIVNDIYIREIARKEDWSFLLASSTITVRREYNTGTIVTANTGATTVTFSTDVALDATYTGYKLKISGNPYVYDFTYESATSGTIQPPISGDTNAGGNTYSLVLPNYSLPTDFDRFPKNGGLVDFTGTTDKIIPESAYQDFLSDYRSSPTNIAAGNSILEINPPPKIAKSYRTDYFLRPRPMRETTAGVINSISASGTTVTGSAGTTRFSEATTGDYFRVDAFGKAGDSEWYRIIAIANNSSLTLQTAFGLSGATSANYTICSAPQMPVRLHPAILYGTILQLSADQDDPMIQGYIQKYAEVLSDGKRLYKTRIYNQDIHHLGEEWLYRR